MENTDEYAKLREQLTTMDWPQVYMFKFIVPAINKQIALVESKFTDEAILYKKESSNGKYISITIKEVMLNPESVIDKYKEMKGIEGLMAL